MLTNVVLAFLCVGFIALAILSAVGFHEEREELTRLDEQNDELARRLDTLTEKLHDATRVTGTGRHAIKETP